MQSIEQKIITAVAKSLEGNVQFHDDDDIVHAIDLAAAEGGPEVWSWWEARRTLTAVVESDVKTIRRQAFTGATRRTI